MLIMRWFLTRNSQSSATVLDQDYLVDLALNFKINKHPNNYESLYK